MMQLQAPDRIVRQEEVKAGQIQISRQRLKGISQVINCRYIVDVNKIILAEKWIV
jgi:hypothetical protein